MLCKQRDKARGRHGSASIPYQQSTVYFSGQRARVVYDCVSAASLYKRRLLPRDFTAFSTASEPVVTSNVFWRMPGTFLLRMRKRR